MTKDNELLAPSPAEVDELREWYEEAVELGYQKLAVPTAWIGAALAAMSRPSVPSVDAEVVERLRKRAEIRRHIPTRKSVQEGAPDRLADLLDEAADFIEALSTRPEGFQAEVDKWMDACFTPAIKADVQERCDRFIEEALEFVQAAGYSADRAHALVDYTFGRPVGEINQEVGGVMVTLAAMCNTLKVDIAAAAATELARVWTKIDVIRAKQAAKPTGSALPIAMSQKAAPAVPSGEA